MARKDPSERVKSKIAILSRHRCCLCAGIDNDWRQKKGQVAHVVSPDRVEIEALAWLCLDHHSEFDSKTSQHRNYSADEVLHWRSRLYKEIGPRLKRGIEFADDVALTPFVLVTACNPDTYMPEGKVHLRNYSTAPGLITEIVVHYHPAGCYRGRMKYPIAGNDEITLVLHRGAPPEGSRSAPDPVAGCPSYEIEVCDLAEIITRRRVGHVGRGLAR